MKFQILQYEIKEKLNDVISFNLPANSEILSIQMQGYPVMWILASSDSINDTANYVERKFFICTTNFPFNSTENNNTKKYVQTYQIRIQGQWIPFHVFEIIQSNVEKLSKNKIYPDSNLYSPISPTEPLHVTDAPVKKKGRPKKENLKVIQ